MLLGGKANGPISEGYQAANAWAVGFKRVVPNGLVHVVNVEQFNSVALSRYAADRLFNTTCCDVIISETDSIGPLQAASDRNLSAIGSHSNQFSLVEVITSREWLWAPILEHFISLVVNNSWQNSSVTFWSTSRDTIKMSSLAITVSKSRKNIFDVEYARVIENEADDIFCGAKFGKPEGVCLSDDEKFRMNYFSSDINFLGTIKIPCSNNCSGHGNCTVEGTCVCETGFAEPDCASPNGSSEDSKAILAIALPLIIVFLIIVGFCVYKYISNRIYFKNLNRWIIPMSDVNFSVQGFEAKRSRGSSILSAMSDEKGSVILDRDIGGLKSFQSLTQVAEGNSWRTHNFISVAEYKGDQVAVKRIDDGLEEVKLRVYTKEIIAVLNMRHENLVPVLGCTYPDPVYIVSKYMARGSLEDVVHDETIPLTVSIKLNFAEGIANGMKYLHDHDIVHESLRPSNVLVDDKFHCEISDYGMSSFRKRLAESHADEFCNPNHLLYEAPEFIPPKRKPKNLNLLKKGNVYSFAMIQLELMVRNFVYAEFRMIYDIEKIVAGIRDKQWRPRLPKHLHEDSNAFRIYYKLTVDCWNENPAERYDFSFIEKVLRKTNKGQGDILQSMMREIYTNSRKLEASLEEQTKRAEEEMVSHTREKLHEMPPDFVAQITDHTGNHFESCCVLSVKVHGISWKKIKDYADPTIAVQILDRCQRFFGELLVEVCQRGTIFAVEENLDRLCYAATTKISSVNIRSIGLLSQFALNRFKAKVIGNLDSKFSNMSLGMGIYHGEAYGGVVGENNHFVLYGDTLETAHRIAETAKPGEALVTEDVMSELKRAKHHANDADNASNLTIGFVVDKSGIHSRPGYRHSFLPPRNYHFSFSDDGPQIKDKETGNDTQLYLLT